MSGIEVYVSVTPNPEVTNLKPLCVCKSSIVSLTKNKNQGYRLVTDSGSTREFKSIKERISKTSCGIRGRNIIWGRHEFHRSHPRTMNHPSHCCRWYLLVRTYVSPTLVRRSSVDGRRWVNERQVFIPWIWDPKSQQSRHLTPTVPYIIRPNNIFKSLYYLHFRVVSPIMYYLCIIH